MADEGVLTDEAMKEMADQLKEKYDEMIESVDKLKEQNINIKKDLISLYGLLRIADNMLDECYDSSPIKMIIELSRTVASMMIDHHIFNIKT